VHGVLREQLLELAEQLRREDLVVRDDQGWPLDLLDHVRDRERLAGAGDAEQDLRLVASLEAFDQLGDRLGLIAGRLEPRGQPKLAVRGGGQARTIAVRGAGLHLLLGPVARHRGTLAQSGEPA
jgi:hypothetical protein